MKTIEIVVIILLFILSILMIISGWDNHDDNIRMG